MQGVIIDEQPSLEHQNHRVKRSTKIPHHIETIAVFDYGFFMRFGIPILEVLLPLPGSAQCNGLNIIIISKE